MPHLLNGQWINSKGTRFYVAVDPTTKTRLNESYPVSTQDEVMEAVEYAARAARAMNQWPVARYAAFLRLYAEKLEAIRDKLVQQAHLETGLPIKPRLQENEFPRMINQLRLAAVAAETCSWSMPTIDSKANIRSVLEPIGPVVIFGPNNFPFAFNAISGGDFAAAVASGNPVIAVANRSHPGTTKMMAECALEAARETDMPAGFIQLFYGMDDNTGYLLVSDVRIGATSFTGSQKAGLRLKRAADETGRPIYLELGGVNAVFILPNALQEMFEKMLNDYVTSVLMGTGQFCTNPGLLILPKGAAGDAFEQQLKERFAAAPSGLLLSESVELQFLENVIKLQNRGATLLTGGQVCDDGGFRCHNTLFTIDDSVFLKNPDELQMEVFGNCATILRANANEMLLIADVLEGGLTGTIYSSAESDESLYALLEPILRPRVGRFLNDKMPTGVAVSAAMNHGGPYPATGHPGFTAVGIPASLRRFGALRCYDNVRENRLPVILRKENALGCLRVVDGVYTTNSIPS